MDDATGDDAMDDATGDDAMDDATGDDAMDDATGDDAMDDTTVEVDEVLDKILDNAIEAYGSSARDVYRAIISPDLAKNRIDAALSFQEYDALRQIVMNLQRMDSSYTFSHRIFSLQVTEPLGRKTGLGFEVQFKSHWIRTIVLRHLEFLEHVSTAAMISDMKYLQGSSFAGFLYEGFATKALAAGESPLDLVLMETKKGKTTFFVPIDHDTTVSPFNRQRVRSYASFSTGPLALEFGVSPEESLADYFWIPMARNNPLFDAFVIEFRPSARIDAVVWILQITLNKDHRGSSEGYQLIKLIKTKVEEAIKTISRTKRRKKKNVIVKYVLVSPEGGQWTLPEKNWESCKGDVYHQRVNYQWYVIAYHVCPDG
jgi:hypothetical protein